MPIATGVPGGGFAAGEALGRLIRARTGQGPAAQGPVPESTIPQAPSLTETPTGIQAPGAPVGDTTVTGAGQALVTAEGRRAMEEQVAQLEDQARATRLAGGVQEDIEDVEARADVLGTQIEEDRAQFQKGLAQTQEQIQGIPEEITSEFSRLREEFGEAADASFDRIDTYRQEALGKAEEGQSAAMQAAVQGIQGTVNSQVAQIMANPDLTQSQKQSMVAQTRLAGASSIAPAIGTTILEFNRLSADVATKFGAITGQIENTVLGAKAELTGLQGQAFSQAQVAVGQMSTQLLEINANASTSFANSQSTLLATRSHATMTGNDILLRTLPEQSTPYLDLTGANTLAYEIGRNTLMDQFRMDLGSAGMRITQQLVDSMRGTPISNMWEGFIGGLAQGGIPGGILGGIGGFLGS